MVSQEDIKKICDATLEIQKCIDDVPFLCDKLNSVDKNYITKYFQSESDGPVVSLRKDICKELFFGKITPSKLLEIINLHKNNNKNAFKSWTSEYRIVNNIINNEYKFIDDIVETFKNVLVVQIGFEVKVKICNFNGAQNQGQSNYWLAFYHPSRASQSESLQLFIEFINGEMKYGIYNHLLKSYLKGPFTFSNLDELYLFINETKLLIESDFNETSSETFITAAVKILKSNNNLPMSAREIWSEIEKNKLYKTTGKTPVASLTTIMLGSSSNSNITNKSKKVVFECVGENPIKFKLINYLSDRVKETLKSEGFITIDQLKEILEKNNIKITI